MSVRATPPNAAAPPAVAAAFWSRFVQDAHVLVAEGFSRLAAQTLQAEDEEKISQRIEAGVNAWFDEPNAPPWTRSYFVRAETRLGDGSRGKQSPRIDIFIESSAPSGRRARFLFEAKRIYRRDSVAEYVSAKGMGAFRDGTYASEAPAAGMLAYVQKGLNKTAIQKVEAKLTNERATHGLAPKGSVWSTQQFDARLGDTYVSQHTRQQPLPTITLYHTFLRCCP